MGFTIEQELAIKTKGNNILVSAAAGSGKTAVLVERIIRMVTDDRNPVDIDRILVVTFTEAAAGEMRQRISNAISEKLNEDPVNEHLLKQMALMPSASISTIHSFCLKVIRNNFHKIELDPAFKIADEIEMSLLKNEIMDDLMEEEYSKEGNDIFLDLIEYFSDGRINDEVLREMIFRVYSFIVNNPWPEECLMNYLTIFNCEDLNDSPWLKKLTEHIKTELNGISAGIGAAIEICNDPEGPVKYIQALQNDMEIIEKLRKASVIGFAELHRAIQKPEYTKLATYRKTELYTDRMLELKEAVMEIRNKNVKDKLKKIKNEIFFKPIDEMFNDIRELKRPVEELCRLTLKFKERFQAGKLEKNVADFNDLEHMCIGILYNYETGEKTKEAHALGEKYVEVFIDEYQDSNIVQEYIMNAVSRDNPPNRFMVGDIKQSIYRFRRANPELFAKKYADYCEELESNDNPSISDGIRIDLSKNFRSRDNVLRAVNFVFRKIMIPELGGIKYDEKAALNTGALFPESDDDPLTVELALIDLDGSSTDHEDKSNADTEGDTDTGSYVQPDASGSNDYADERESADSDDELNELSKVEAEFGYIADRIKELTDKENGIKIFDKSLNGYRNAEYRDIVILARSISNVEDAVCSEMKKRGIPVYIEQSTGFFKNVEVATVLSYLSIIDNPRQDIPLIAVLHSPMYRVTASELAELRSNRVKCDYYSCVKQYHDDNKLNENELHCKVKRFFKDLEEFRKKAWHLSVSELVCDIFHKTGYYNYAGAMPGGSVKQANLLALKEFAEKYEKGSLRGLFNFIRYMEKVAKSDSDTGEAKIISDGLNLVRVMTIHKSKGLEFPVVFISLLGKKFNSEDEKASIILHQSLGFGPMYFNSEHRYKSNTLARIALLKQIHIESLSEELRVLYVAMTRSKEKLIMTGVVRDLKRRIKLWNVKRIGTELPAYYLLHSAGFIDWVCAAGADNRVFSNYISDMVSEQTYEDSDVFDVKIVNVNDIGTKYLEQLDSEKIVNVTHEVSVDDINEIDEKMTWIYPYTSGKNVPSALSITEIYKLQDERTDENTVDFLENTVFEVPAFLRKDSKITAMRRGTVIHIVMKNIDFNKTYDENEILQILGKLVDNGKIEPGEDLVVPVRNIAEFSHSDLAKRIARSKSVKRETPFVMGLNPADIYANDTYQSDEMILVRGIIDCFFVEDDKAVIVDYKSEKLTNVSPEYLNKYKVQLSVYKQAVQNSTGIEVKQCLLYSISDNLELEIQV